MALPDSWVQKYVEAGRGATFYGQPVLDMSAAELMAVIGYMVLKEVKIRDAHLEQIDLLKEFGRMRGSSKD
jgi:hypothetical protein